MQLARIEHWRCGEPLSWNSGNGYTYVWVVDGVTEDEFRELCDKAQKFYLDCEHEFKKLVPVPAPGYVASIQTNTPDDKTVYELRAEHAAHLATYTAYQDKVKLQRRPYAYWLESVGNGKIKLFHAEKPDLQIELSWGHNHGTTIEHSPTKMSDYPFPVEEDDVSL